jgi:hypothetical protein
MNNYFLLDFGLGCTVGINNPMSTSFSSWEYLFTNAYCF